MSACVLGISNKYAERRKFSLVDSETQETLARANPTIAWQRIVDELQPFGNSQQPFLEA